MFKICKQKYALAPRFGPPGMRYTHEEHLPRLLLCNNRTHALHLVEGFGITKVEIYWAN